MSLPELWEKTYFLADFLQQEYNIEKRLDTEDNFHSVLGFMVERNIVTVDNGYVRANKENTKMFDFLLNLVWPVIDTYWIVFLYSYALVPNYHCSEKQMYEQISKFA